MASAVPDLGKVALAFYRERGRRNGGGDGVFWLVENLVAVVVWPERHWPGLFIGRPWQRQREKYLRPLEIFPAARSSLNHHSGSPQFIRTRALVRELGAYPWRQ